MSMSISMTMTMASASTRASMRTIRAVPAPKPRSSPTAASQRCHHFHHKHGPQHRRPAAPAATATATVAAATATATLATAAAFILTTSYLHADAPTTTTTTTTDKTQQDQMRARARSQGVYAWGSNRHLVVAPDQPSVALVRSPRSIPFFDGIALRDLVLSERHGVAVDANGDILQWGAGFFDARSRTADGDQTSIDDIPYTSRAARFSSKPPPGRESASPMLPVKTLVGKDIVKVQANDSKVFALAKNGDLWILSAIQQQQHNRSQSSWLPSFLNPAPSIDAQKFSINKSANPLRRGEKIVDITAGDAHLLALTNQERTFAAPTGADANIYGQLGFRRALLNTVQASAHDPSLPSSTGTVTGSLEVALEPRIVLDSIINAPTPTAVDLLPAWALPPSVEARAAEAQRAREQAARTKAEQSKLAAQANSQSRFNVPSIVEDPNSIRYCTTLHEIPALRGVPVVQIAAGSQHSLARTADGRVLGWGRHTHGQSGVGPQVAIECVTAPTEVVLARAFPSSVDVRCTAIYAGSDNSFFVTARLEPLGGRSGLRAVRDVLSCGKGIWGTLGAANWQQVASSPVRVKTVSGLQEYSERTGKIHPVDMHSISIGSPGHVALVLDTVDHDTHSAFGRDVNVWGSNAAYQLGTGKRNNLAVPQHLPPLPPLTPSEGAEAPPLPDDKERERLREEDINSGALTHMPHNRLQLASQTIADTRTAPALDKDGHLVRGSIKHKVPIEETMVAGAAAMAVFWRIH